MFYKLDRAFIWLQLPGRAAPSRLSIYLVYSVTLVIILAAGLWPLNFNPKNQAVWLKGRNGIQFSGRGMILGTLPFPLTPKSTESRQPITVELLIQSFAEPRDSLPQFLTALDEHSGEDFFIGQWKSELVLRSRSRGRASAFRFREIGLRGVFSRDKERLITVTSGDAGTIVYLNGAPGKISPHFFLLPPDGAGQVTLLIGTSQTGNAGLKGIISGLAIYSRVLSADQIGLSCESWKKQGRTLLGKEEGLAALYLFDEHVGNTIRNHIGPGQDLIIPEVFRPLKRVILEFNWKRIGLNRSFLSDAAINIAGFIVFGLAQGMVFLSIPQMRRNLALFLTLISGSALSMMIELAQVCLPTRDSDFIDWICNTLGTLAAVIILHKCYKPFHPV